MNIEGTVFLIGFFACVGLFFWKLYNVFLGGELYDPRVSWLTFIGFWTSYLVGLLMFLADPLLANALLFRVVNLLAVLLIPLQVGEVFFKFRVLFPGQIKAYMAKPR